MENKHAVEGMEPLLLRPEDAARLLGIGRSKLYCMLQRGELPQVRVGHSVRVPLAALRRWIADLEVAN